MADRLGYEVSKSHHQSVTLFITLMMMTTTMMKRWEGEPQVLWKKFTTTQGTIMLHCFTLCRWWWWWCCCCCCCCFWCGLTGPKMVISMWASILSPPKNNQEWERGLRCYSDLSRTRWDSRMVGSCMEWGWSWRGLSSSSSFFYLRKGGPGKWRATFIIYKCAHVKKYIYISVYIWTFNYTHFILRYVCLYSYAWMTTKCMCVLEKQEGPSRYHYRAPWILRCVAGFQAGERDNKYALRWVAIDFLWKENQMYAIKTF